MHNEPLLHEVKVVPDPDDGPYLYLVDSYGNKLCRVAHDDTPEDILHGVAKAICGAAGVKFTPLEGWK